MIIVDEFLPPSCLLCSTWLRGGGAARPFCEACLEVLASYRVPGDGQCPRCGGLTALPGSPCAPCVESPSPLDAALSLLEYRGEAKEAILLWKFGKRRALSDFFAQLLAEALRALGWDAGGGRCLLVPVPPRRGKLRAEGFDQVESLVTSLGRRGLRCGRFLERLDARPQKRLGREERLSHLGSSIRLRRGATLPAVPLILLDDVRTTGATLASCAAALKAGGARDVRAVAIARD